MSRPAGAPPLDQHNIEIHRNQAAWHRKPMLRKVYHDFYRKIAARINPAVPGPVVELGSGMGRIKDIIPACVTTDLFANPWLDRQENCYQLSFADGEVSHLILFDVWHHLRYPGTALREFQRVLAPGGRVILCEPAASWVGRLVYHYFHHEPVALREPFTWEAAPGFAASDADYYAAQSAASRIFWWGEDRARLANWNLREVLPLSSFSYFASGGFSGPQLGGPLLHGLMRVVDAVTAPFPRAFAARLIVVLEKPRNSAVGSRSA